MREPAAPDHRAARLLRGARADARARSRRCRRPTRQLFSDMGTTLRRRSRATRRRCRTRSPRRRRRSTSRRGRCASSARSWPTRPRSRATSTGPASSCARALPDINPALEDGRAGASAARSLNAELQEHDGRAAGPGPGADARTRALRALTATVGTLNPQLRFLGPHVTVCNYWNYFWTFVAEHLSERRLTGDAQRALFNSDRPAGQQRGHAGRRPPANGDSPAPRRLAAGVPARPALRRRGRRTGEADCEHGPARLHRSQPQHARLQGRRDRFNIVTRRRPTRRAQQGPTGTGLTAGAQGRDLHRASPADQRPITRRPGRSAMRRGRKSRAQTDFAAGIVADRGRS